MTIREFKENLDKLIAERPEVLDFEACYASDAEGNSFHPLHNDFSVGQLVVDGWSHEFRGEDEQEEEDDEEWESDFEANAVCVN